MKAKENIDELIKEEKRKYYKNWRKNNKDKIKKHNKDYWKKRAMKKLNKK